MALAARNQSQLIVLTAVDPLLAEPARTRLGLDLAKAETKPALREFVKAALPKTAPWAPQTAFDVCIGDSSEMILQAAAREHVDLITMGTHGLGGFRKLLLGSTTERVLRRTSTAVLAVPLVKTQSVMLDTNGPRFDLGRILMGTDFSEASAAALRWAADLAQQLEVPLLLSHVVTPVTVPARWRVCCRGRRGAGSRRTDTARDALQTVQRHNSVGGRGVDWPACRFDRVDGGRASGGPDRSRTDGPTGRRGAVPGLDCLSRLVSGARAGARRADARRRSEQAAPVVRAEMANAERPRSFPSRIDHVFAVTMEHKPADFSHRRTHLSSGWPELGSSAAGSNWPLPYRWWIYVMAAGGFVLFHVIHASIVYERNYWPTIMSGRSDGNPLQWPARSIAIAIQGRSHLLQL